MQQALFGAAHGVTGDPLERFYTGIPLARACVARAAPHIAELLGERLRPGAGLPLHLLELVEPSVGAGSFVRALRSWWGTPEAVRMIRKAGAAAVYRRALTFPVRLWVTGIDLDPHAAGFALCSDHHVGDFARCPPLVSRAPLRVVLGNPPFSVAPAHVLRALQLADLVAFILPLSVLEGCGAWGPLLLAHPAEVHPIPGRPWRDHVRGCAWFVWRSDHNLRWTIVSPYPIEPLPALDVSSVEPPSRSDAYRPSPGTTLRDPRSDG